MSTPSRLRIKSAPSSEQPASGFDFYASTTWLHTKLPCLVWRNINGRKAHTSMHVLEALVFFCTRGATEFRMAPPVKPNVHKVDDGTVQCQCFVFGYEKGELDGLMGLSFTKVVHRFMRKGDATSLLPSCFNTL